MNSNETLQAIEAKKMKPIDFIYLGIIFFFFLITAILFFFSTGFIVENINKVFTTNGESTSQSLNIELYSAVEKKLNLPVNIEKPSQTINTPVENVTVNNTATEPVAVVGSNDKSMSINVLNGSNKAGVATTLSKILENAGFLKVTSGSSNSIYKVTTIFIKEGVKNSSGEIEEIVKKSYPKSIIKINPESSDFDVVIIIA